MNMFESIDSIIKRGGQCFESNCTTCFFNTDKNLNPCTLKKYAPHIKMKKFKNAIDKEYFTRIIKWRMTVVEYIKFKKIKEILQ